MTLPRARRGPVDPGHHEKSGGIAPAAFFYALFALSVESFWHEACPTVDLNR
jgi:hypothetical protein